MDTVWKVVFPLTSLFPTPVTATDYQDIEYTVLEING